jgi:hypothetical protein
VHSSQFHLKRANFYQIFVFPDRLASNASRGTNGEGRDRLWPAPASSCRSTERSSLSESNSFFTERALVAFMFGHGLASKYLHIFVFIVFLLHNFDIHDTICLALVFVSMSVCHSASVFFAQLCAAPHFLCFVNAFSSFCTNRHISHCWRCSVRTCAWHFFDGTLSHQPDIS